MRHTPTHVLGDLLRAILMKLGSVPRADPLAPGIVLGEFSALFPR